MNLKIERKHIIIIIALALGAGLAYDSLFNYVNPYISVTEIINQKNTYQGKSLQVMGLIESNSLQRSDDGRINFRLTDGTMTINVSYKGVPPQNLEPGNDVVVMGSLSDTGLEATQILVKCPSKYEDDQQQGTSHVFLATIAVAILGAGYILFTMFWKKN